MLHSFFVWSVALSLCVATQGAVAADPSLQDLQVIGRALSFKEGAKRTTLSLAMVYDGTSARSQGEMQATLAAVRGGLRVGDAVLKVVAVEQNQFASPSGFDGILTLSDVDQTRLAGTLNGRGVPCLTLDAQQVKNGACTVAIRSRPSVTISINSKNAAAAHVRFATAFIMMVREI
ncbi:hypothetical protein [Aureimonas phyllosphaerae]|uniref:YfiR family protein n=1 Tax=Aureimonas phyllosphaerae TaxID=1166078 RepID=A0A7W6FUX8_9HYPH|nr:hypothetical protein [Aureimonas phyllosphaerae]MBB3936573.1 hypothetical protein [Aureimonas phyllosphaerae]MBB3960563.1 hypothetical protein [Aureimonas phyllosphaerae]SFF24649.1 hypothetical protein SAMN05216566_105203 [Aureimonas phyllosphaerae]